jgi:hypothetical protein
MTEKAQRQQIPGTGEKNYRRRGGTYDGKAQLWRRAFDALRRNSGGYRRRLILTHTPMESNIMSANSLNTGQSFRAHGANKLISHFYGGSYGRKPGVIFHHHTLFWYSHRLRNKVIKAPPETKKKTC